jgi:hypothetical protein
MPKCTTRAATKPSLEERFAANLKKLYCTPIRNEFGIKGRGWRGIRVRTVVPTSDDAPPF